MNRRQLLKLGIALPLASACGRLYAVPRAPAKLLVVFLRGGYDATNFLVPVTSQFYYDARPNIAIAVPGPDPNTALPLDADWGLHPSQRETVYPLFKQGQVAFVPFCGTDDLTRSHFETQDSIELGQPIDGGRDFQSGFLNRLVGVLRSPQPIAFTDQLPIVFRGERDVPNMALRSLGKPGIDSRQSAIIGSMYQRTSLAVQVNEGFGLRDEVMLAMAPEMEAASRGAITTKGFELEARRIAKLMADKFDIGFVDVGGWDTHVGQGGATGLLAGRLDELGKGLAAIAREMGPRWQDTVVVVVSEFGRTFRENGNRGTDHGHGSVYWVLGGGVHGGRIAGDQIRLTQSTLFQNRDYPVLSDYRALFAGLFARMYGLDATQLSGVFPGARAKDLGLI
jgi:uncharacterized protein (DUF1501 family)